MTSHLRTVYDRAVSALGDAVFALGDEETVIATLLVIGTIPCFAILLSQLWIGVIGGLAGACGAGWWLSRPRRRDSNEAER